MFGTAVWHHEGHLAKSGYSGEVNSVDLCNSSLKSICMMQGSFHPMSPVSLLMETSDLVRSTIQLFSYRQGKKILFASL